MTRKTFTRLVFSIAASKIFTGHTMVCQSGRENGEMESFRIQIADKVLEDLWQRLERTRFPDSLDDVGWEYGTDPVYLKELVDYWKTEFNWRKQEQYLNSFPQFKVKIEGLDVHFLHVRSKHDDALPLLMAHGWPDSAFGFQKVIGPLTDPTSYGGLSKDAFHIVCPSMMGYGFSDKPKDRGWSVNRMGEVAAKLMAKLGYDRYGAQGGDWGSGVATWLGRYDEDHVTGIHITLVGTQPPEDMKNPEEGIPEWELKRTVDRKKWWDSENAYGKIQGTKPQTLGYGLNDSPVGLAAWILEKWRTWSDSNGNVESRFSKDEILTNVMLYWLTESITSSFRIYYESMRLSSDKKRVELPTAVAVFPGEIFFSPRKWVETAYNVTQWTEMHSGGHFAAMEEPELLVADVRHFFRDLR